MALLKWFLNQIVLLKITIHWLIRFVQKKEKYARPNYGDMLICLLSVFTTFFFFFLLQYGLSPIHHSLSVLAVCLLLSWFWVCWFVSIFNIFAVWKFDAEKLNVVGFLQFLLQRSSVGRLWLLQTTVLIWWFWRADLVLLWEFWWFLWGWCSEKLREMGIFLLFFYLLI